MKIFEYDRDARIALVAGVLILLVVVAFLVLGLSRQRVAGQTAGTMTTSCCPSAIMQRKKQSALRIILGADRPGY